MVDTDWVRAYAVEIGPGKSTLCHRHSLPYLMYVAGEAEILSQPRRGDARKHHYLDTYCEFSPAGLEHIVRNLADKPFRNLIFEVPPAAAKLRRPGLGFAQVAGVRISILYSGESICAQLVELSAGSQTQVTGPAIVASVDADPVEFISPEHGTRSLQGFQDLESLPTGSSGLLRCEAGGPVRVLVVTLGCE
jgi:hypothetical protein